MKDAQDAGTAHVLNEALAFFKAWQQQIEHVKRLLAMYWDDRQANRVRGGPLAKVAGIGLPDRLAALLDGFGRFQLRQQVGGQQVGRQIARADVDPRVLIDLAPEELRAVGALLPDDLGPLNQLRRIDQQRTALAAGDVLGLVKAQRGQPAETAQRASPVFSEEPVGVVLDHRDP